MYKIILFIVFISPLFSQLIPKPNSVFTKGTKIDGTVIQMKFGTITSETVSNLWDDYQVMKRWEYKQLLIYMNSTGGKATAGIATADLLNKIKSDDVHITIEAHGIIASAAVPIFLTANKRICGYGTIFLIHPASIYKTKSSEDLEKLESQTKMIEMINNSFAKLISDNSKLTFSKSKELLKNDHWFTATEAKKMGFVDIIK